MQAFYTGFFTFFVNFAMQACLAVVIYYGAVLHNEGSISIGDITAFLLYMLQLIMNFVVLAMVFGNVFKMVGASEKIIELMQYVPDVNTNGGIQIAESEVKGELELKNLVFRYPTKPDVLVCDNISLKIPQNKVVALVGQSGCGKSSLISLIERYYEPESGSILFSG